MRTVNKVILLGYVGSDPEFKSKDGGIDVANLSLATSYRIAKKNGADARDVTEWHRLIAFGPTAGIIRGHVKKGTPLYIEGHLQTRSWEDDKIKVKRWTTEIIVRELSILTPKEAGAKPPEMDETDTQTAAAMAGRGADPEITDDDIPF